jgi:2-methylfumaryl-CoA hydratase
MLDEFEVGAVFDHPWEVTVDAGALALYAASFLDATPVFASARYARALGFHDRPVPPLALLNYGLSFSVHDVSEQAIAHLAYIDVRFPHPCYPGDTLRASSKVLGVKRSSDGERGVVHVGTTVAADETRVVCRFERKVLVRAGGRIADRPSRVSSSGRRPAEAGDETLPGDPRASQAPGQIPSLLERPLDLRDHDHGFAGFFEDFAPGSILCHDVGRTVGESEHMQLTYLFRNTHPLHFEEPYARTGFAKTRVVYGGLVFAWVAALASRDTCGNVLWEARFDKGAHPAGVLAGDTLYAASRVLAREDRTHDTGTVTFKLVGTKNVKPSTLLDAGADLFGDELTKRPADKLPDKVFEIERTVLMRKRP